jgi:hypothetical protein
MTCVLCNKEIDNFVTWVEDTPYHSECYKIKTEQDE